MSKPKRKSGSINQNQRNNGQKTSQERVSELIQQQQDKKEAELLSEERIQKKLQELEEQRQANEKALADQKESLERVYDGKKKELAEEYDLKKLELDECAGKLDEQKKAQEEKEIHLQNTEKQVREQCESAVAEEISRIRADERSIREREKETAYEEWEADKSRQRSELEDYVRSQRSIIDTELEKAHEEKVDAESKKLAKLHEADAEIEKRIEELTREYSEKVAELSQKKLEYQRRLQELEEQKADINADSEYVKELKQKYSQYSEKEVLKLQQQVRHYEEQIEVYTDRIKELSEKAAHMEGSLLDDNGHSLVVRISELEDQLSEAKRKNDELANMPSSEEIERLRASVKELETVRVSLDDEKQRRQEAEAKISAYAMGMRELENARISAAALESLNNQLQMKLKYISEQYKTTQESKFKVLLDIDSDIQKQGIHNPKGYGKPLKELCEYVRNYGAAKKGLYYSLDTIKVFFASLAASSPASRLLILQGLSGTGKSSLPRLVAEALNVECKLVQVQPSWRDNRELLGYDNDFTNRFKETEFTKYLYEASALPNRRKVYFIVLDEMNLARVEYYFADFLSILEKPDQNWMVPLVSGYSELDEDQKPRYLDYSNEAANICITNNIWFIGTANNDDSTSLITDKVYDRAQVLDMDKREDRFEGANVTQVSMDVDELLSLFAAAKANKDNLISKQDTEALKEVDEYLKEMDITFGNRILNQMNDFVPVYIACGGTKEEAIDYLLTHKILRKLDERYEPYLDKRLEDLATELDDKYGKGKFTQSLTKIAKLRNKIKGN